MQMKWMLIVQSRCPDQSAFAPEKSGAELVTRYRVGNRRHFGRRAPAPPATLAQRPTL